MDRAAYFVWLLLPLALGLLTGWSWMKRVGKASGQEDVGLYFKQFCFVLLGYVVAIFADKALGERIYEVFPDQEQNIDIARWLVYPALLLLMAYALGVYDARKVKRAQAEAAAKKRRR